MKTGLLLAQLGTPEAPTAEAVREYLREFLGDRRVVDYPRWFWRPLLHGVILRVRPARSARLYRKIWTEEGSPLLVHGRRLCEGVQEALGADWTVVLGMRYGEPSMTSALDRLIREGVQSLVVLPLFPQYSWTTTESVRDVVEPFCRRTKLPLRWIDQFHQDEGYLDALQALAQEEVERAGEPDHWLLSFHGLPRRFVRSGDPYPDQCEQTGQALAHRMGWPSDHWELAYQSRFGPEPWLTPATAGRLVELGKRGVGDLCVMTPGFAADCLETIDEIGELGARAFERAGGGRLRRVPALNEHPAWVEAVARMALRRARPAPSPSGSSSNRPPGNARSEG